MGRTLFLDRQTLYFYIEIAENNGVTLVVIFNFITIGMIPAKRTSTYISLSINEIVENVQGVMVKIVLMKISGITETVPTLLATLTWYDAFKIWQRPMKENKEPHESRLLLHLREGNDNYSREFRQINE